MTTTERLDCFTIEPGFDTEGHDLGTWEVYGHSTYGRESILEGQPKRVFVESYSTLESAQLSCPTADVTGNTRQYAFGDSLADMSGLPECPPSWFDPEDAGEWWGDDY